MDRFFRYYPRISTTDSTVNYEYWKKALVAYESGKYREAINAVMKYTGAEKAFPFTGDLSEDLVHGSVVVNFAITGNTYTITAPFLKLPDGPAAIAVMRQALELNFSSLVMSKIICRDNNMIFYFSDTVNNVNPFKLFFVLEEICQSADYYDDYFMDKFGATRITEPELKHLGQGQKDRAYEVYTTILKDALKNAGNFAAKSTYGPVCDIMMVCFMQIDYVMSPQGELGRLVAEALNVSKTGTVEEAGMKSIELAKALLAYDRKKFDSCMYVPKFLVPFKKGSSVAYMKEFFAKPFEQAGKYLDAGQVTMASVEIVLAFYAILWISSIPGQILGIIDNALKSASDKNWEQAVSALYPAMEKIMKADV